jgi:hypothetical protein
MQDGSLEDPGLAMNDVLTLANRSKAQSVLLILDCCFSGSIGNPPNLQSDVENQAQLREGVTILAASRPTQPSMEVGDHGVFTNLVIGALRGGSADVRGRVSAASIYAYAEAALVPGSSAPCTNPTRTALILCGCVNRASVTSYYGNCRPISRERITSTMKWTPFVRQPEPRLKV